MLSRLQDPDGGRVRMDGVDLRDLEIEGLRRRIAVVPQDVFLFPGSILENVRLFDEEISEQRVLDALDAVQALDFVGALECGVHATLEERGATLSRGEQQLLSFARALAADPDLLLLDEATASIDTENEQRIQAALDRLLADRTCVVVAHRLSTVRDADRILVMEDGRIVEEGSHDELMGLGGRYARMVNTVGSG
jgi:ABC-type multidrug transport system fused ATPase/permease subunit